MKGDVTESDSPQSISGEGNTHRRICIAEWYKALNACNSQQCTYYIFISIMRYSLLKLLLNVVSTFELRVKE